MLRDVMSANTHKKKKTINALTPMRTNVNIHILVYKHENKKGNGWRDELGSKK